MLIFQSLGGLRWGQSYYNLHFMRIDKKIYCISELKKKSVKREQMV